MLFRSEQVVEDDGEFDDEEDGEEEVRCSGILCLPYLFICFICVAW